MKNIYIIFLFLFIAVSINSCRLFNGSNCSVISNGENATDTTFVRPEDFGAKGDGYTDDSPSFNECIATGLPIHLTKGQSYRLISKIEPIRSNSFILKGNNADILIDKTYPMERYTLIFRFKSDGIVHSTFSVSDFTATFFPEDKFDNPEEVGDTYFIFLDKCDNVSIEGISFKTPSLRNNLTFLATFGVGSFEMSGCNVSINSLSKQGGAVWIMNKYYQNCNINIHNCNFEHDTQDECICFSGSEFEGVTDCTIKAKMTDCSIASKCKSPSSGFMMATHNEHGKAVISLVVRRCVFVAHGLNSRKILSFQSGEGESGTYANINSEFINCDFDYDFKGDYDNGLLSLPYLSGPYEEEFVFCFKRCRFRMRGIHPLIGDRDGSKSGTYIFRRCKIDTDGPVFEKQYNVSSSRINITEKNNKIYFEEKN